MGTRIHVLIGIAIQQRARGVPSEVENSMEKWWSKWHL